MRKESVCGTNLPVVECYRMSFLSERFSSREAIWSGTKELGVVCVGGGSEMDLAT